MGQFIWKLGLSVCLAGLISCQAHKELVPKGLKFAQIGEEMIAPDTHKIKGKYLRDTLFQEEEYTWRAAILDYPTGKVYIEEDFYGQNRINRIRVEASQFSFRKELFPGMSLAELRQLSWQWEMTYLEAYQVWDLTSQAFPRLHLLVPVETSSISDPYAVSSLDQLPDTQTISSLVFL